jgi:hypothetical protein
MPWHKKSTVETPVSTVLSSFFFPASAAKAVICPAAASAAKPLSNAGIHQLKKYSKISKGL